MSKDNTVLILQATNGFFVVNTSAVDNIEYEADTYGEGVSKDSNPQFNKKYVKNLFANAIRYADFVENSLAIFSPVICQNLQQAKECADEMCQREEKGMGCGPEYGTWVHPCKFPENLGERKYKRM